MDPSVMWPEAQTHLFTLCRYWGAAESGWGSQQHATYIILFESAMLNTGEPARDVKESGKEAGETRTEISEALQAVKWAIVV
jgi:hypothetical protein